jgi:SPP1 gp7 family putative phage head morphogenesis protein
MITPQELQRTKAELDRMEEALLTRYLQYSLVRSGHIEQMIAEGQPVESIVKMVWKGLREIWEQNLADAMLDAFKRGYARVQRLMLPYQLQEKEFPWGTELTAVIRALAAEKVKIEENTTKAKIKEVVMDGIKEGLNPNDIAKNIHEKVGLGMARARNIASTEINFAYSLGHWVGAVEAGVEKVRIVAALDAFVCEHCREMDGKVLDVATLEAGYLPPFHFQCRCHLQPLLGSLARVPTSEDLPSRGDWVQKGFGIPGGKKSMQVAIEKVLPSISALRTEVIERLVEKWRWDGEPMSPRAMEQKVKQAQRHFEKVTSQMSLTQMQALENQDIRMIIRRFPERGADAYTGGFYRPARGTEPPLICINQRGANESELYFHETAHSLQHIYPETVYRAEEIQLFLKKINDARNILLEQDEKMLRFLTGYTKEEIREMAEGDLIRLLDHLSHLRASPFEYLLTTDKEKEEFSKFYVQLVLRIEQEATINDYALTAPWEYTAVAAQRYAEGFPIPKDVIPFIERFYFASPQSLVFTPLQEEEVEEIMELPDELKGERTLQLLIRDKEGRLLAEVIAGKEGMDYQMKVRMPRLERILKEGKEGKFIFWKNEVRDGAIIDYGGRFPITSRTILYLLSDIIHLGLNFVIKEVD